MKLSLTNHNLLYLERYVNEGTKTYSRFAGRSDVSTRYRPGSDVESFELITVKVPREKASVWQAEPAEELRDFYLRSDSVLFAVHPETWMNAELEGMNELRTMPRVKPLVVAPTASTRTVLVANGEQRVPEHFLKLHYPGRISRFNRKLRRKNISNGVAITKDLANVHLDKFAYLPEVMGVTFGNRAESWGFLVREQIPRPFQPSRFLIPCFALYGGDLQHSEDAPLLIQMIEHARANPEDFVVDQIMIPIVECWAGVVRRRGILLESHAQNLLLEIDESLKPVRIVHRDFDVWIDFDTRRRHGLDIPFLDAAVGSETGHSVKQHYSLIYDRFIGVEFFDYVLETLSRFFSINKASVRDRVSQAFHQFFPDSEKFFPGTTTFYFADMPDESREFSLVDTKQAPVWR